MSSTGRVGLGDVVLVLLVGGEEEDVVADPGHDADGADARLGELVDGVGGEHLALLDAAVGYARDAVRPASTRESDVLTSRYTRRNGVSMNPNSLTRAKVASEPMRPMFGPSGVSIGQMRP